MYSKTKTMSKILSNIIHEINNIKQNKFTKKEILEILNLHITQSIENDVLPNLEFDGFILAPTKYTIEGNGINHKLPKKQFDLLYFLIRNKNRIYSRQQILSAIWEEDICVGNRTIDVHIRKIRRVLDKYNRIETYKKLGYMWKD